MSKATSHVVYIAGPDTSADHANACAQQQGLKPPVLLKRRGTALGWVAQQPEPTDINADSAAKAWHNASAYALPGYVSAALPPHQDHIKQALNLMAAIAEGAEVASLFEQPPYSERTTPQFEMLASFQDEGDAQEIETIEYDAVNGDDVVAENLWCKASWLSFEDDDASLRFRFSFGMVGYEDVAADLERQRYAAQLTDAIFPESGVISNNSQLDAFMQTVVGTDKLAYVERIIYFNAPNGGAQFHQDVERGHLGVVFAQVHGSTAWLACSKTQLMDEVQAFINHADNSTALDELMNESMLAELKEKASSRAQLNEWLDERDNEPLELLLNRCPEFYRHLFGQGYGYIINPGDIILLPQKSSDECCWHTVFCIDDFVGESLSFAIRAID
ncbi:MAG TPA: hypothetical protein ENJ65_02665 [Candidatus Tenderia electrophaga]|uniref:Uncharacterized protein n=1 Tax=Candidatus Tenderia electrophaga TaxID=1748243 RepID=A0A832J624_9GAMM|nr:hypothetical protein [Candidatus Tenderia electrophaga]